MSAPRASARLASSFMNEMRVASMALAAYLVSSAERVSMTSRRSWLRWNGAYTARIMAIARSSSAPITTRSGFMKSSTAAPSLRNSGLETTAKGSVARRAVRARRRWSARTRSAVPTGTVDLSIITLKSLMRAPMLRAAASTCCRSAEPSSSGGVPTAMNCSVPCSTACIDIGGEAQPAAGTLRRMTSGNPGSWIGTPPLSSTAILAASTSKQSTSLPTSARQAPLTRPT